MKILNNLNLEPYGYSHSEIIGFKLDGIPSGYLINIQEITKLLDLRRGNKLVNTTRSENDNFIIKSGFDNFQTNGESIIIEITQTGFNSNDYEYGVIRPGHADLSAYLKYQNDYQYAGGGQFSGRMTVLYVIAGEICRQILSQTSNTSVIGHVLQVGDYIDEFGTFEQVKAIQNQPFPMCNLDIKMKTIDYINTLKANGESIGGKVRFLINPDSYYGDQFFQNLESKISFMLFTIPGVKAIEFGLGTKFANKQGTEVVEQLVAKNSKVNLLTNYNGGINGGIANTLQPIEVLLTIKPPSSIFKNLQTVKWSDSGFRDFELKLQGRHDSFIGNRSIWPGIGLLNILFLDLEMENNAK